MKRLSIRLAIAGLVALAVLAGCSDDADRLTSSDATFDPAPVAAYFPLAPDYATMVNVQYADGGSETVVFEVGKKQPLYEYEAYPLYAWDKNNQRTTSYIVVTDSALFIMASGRSTPEKMLSLPLRPGASWDRHDLTELSRFEAEDEEDSGSEDLQTGDEDDPSGDLEGFGTDDQADDESDNENGAVDEPVQVSFPTTGGSQMQVQTVESIALSDGTVFAGAVRIATAGAYGKTNYYWYVPGVGLAKYVLGASQQNPYSGSEVGEVVTYGVGLK